MSERVALVIDDDRDLHALLGVALRRWARCRVEAVTSGADGVARAAALRPDVTLLDMTLPDADGLEILKRLRADPATADLLVVVLSADVRRHDREELVAAGAAAVFGKPFRPSELAAEVDRLIGRA